MTTPVNHDFDQGAARYQRRLEARQERARIPKEQPLPSPNLPTGTPTGAPPPNKGMDLGSKVALAVIGALVIGGAAFGGYTLLNNNAEKTACQQLANPAVHSVNPSHAWDLYEVYMAAPSGTYMERNSINELNNFCQARGVRTNDLMPSGSY